MAEVKIAAAALGTEHIRRLLVQYAVPAIIAMTAASLYNMVDSIFIGHGVGPLAISGLALTFPLMNLAAAFGSLVGVGAATLISMRLGQRDYATAQHVLGNVVVLNLIIGVAFGAAALVFLDPILYFFGASDATIGYARDYMTIILLGNVVTHMYLGLNAVLRASGHPRKSMYATINTVLINTVLDPLFIYGFGWGIRGAAVATGLGYSVTAVAGLVVFCRKSSFLHFQRPSFRPGVLIAAAANGCSEMAGALVTGIVTLAFNWMMLKAAGEEGVAAVTIIMYVLMFASSLYTGYSYGVAPMLSYYWGEGDSGKLKRVVSVSLKVIAGISLLTAAASFLFTEPMVTVFARPGNPVHALAVTGNKICTAALLFIGFNIFGSGMFTALSNGAVSAVLAFSRSFVFMLAALFLLPLLLGINGVWLATPAAEFMALVLSGCLFLKYRERYGYC